jgi:hypothetical protein
MKKLLAISAALGLFAPSLAFAQDLSVSANANVNATVKSSNSSTTVKSDADADVDEDHSATSTDNGNRGESRSTVAVQVQALLNAANRDGGIGAEVREIAHALASSTERLEEKKDRVENRPGWMIFFVGADYKNIGKVRSELQTTNKEIDRLKTARDRATDATAKAELDVQINALMALSASTEAFLEAHEDNFSVFGWFFKLVS